MEYDVIIVGAGSAGCVLAARLSENPDRRVLLIEAGGEDRHPYIHMPAGFARLVDHRDLTWGYETEPQSQLNGRRLFWPRGKTLGGSSSINAMCYCRGHRIDYDLWEAGGATGWGFDSVLPLFIKSENHHLGKSEYHGEGGPLSVSALRHTNALSKVFLRAAEQAGHARTDDFNGPDQLGFSFYEVTQKKGRRCSAATAFLKPVRGRPNLEIRTDCLVEKVLISNGSASGVRLNQRGESFEARSDKVVVSAGAINSPQLLMLSGVGPAEHLRAHGIEPLHDLQGVGGNLQDHLDICTLVRSRVTTTYDQLNHFLVGLRYFLTGRGPASSNVAEAGGFVRSHLATDDRPDIQFHFVPALLDNHGRNKIPGHGLTIHSCALRPQSRGTIRLRSSSPQDSPLIQPNYLAESYDREMMLECARLSRDIFAQPAFSDVRGDEIFPGAEVTSDEDLLAFVRLKAETIYHPVGTCRMGNDDQAVVDPDLYVRGVDNLAVVDASVMPSLISGNTNAPTIMIAEKFAAAFG